MLVAQRLGRAGRLVAGVEVASAGQGRLIDDVVVPDTRRRWNLRGELVAQVDVDVFLANDVVEAPGGVAGDVALGDPALLDARE